MGQRTNLFGAVALLGLLVTSLTPVKPALAAEGDTLQRIQERGAIALGYREDRPPMSFRNPDGQITGFSIDLCLEIVNTVKAELNRPDLAITFVPVGVEDRFQAIEEGRIDLLCGATTKTLARQTRVDFTNLTFVTGATLLSLGDNPVSGLSALAGKTVAVVEDTTTLDALSEGLQRIGSDAIIVTVGTAKEGVEAVVSGEVAAFASDQVVLIGLVITSTHDLRFAIAQELFSFEPFALALPRNDSDFRLIANATLADLYRSGRITPIYERWFSRFAEEVPDLLRALYILGSTPR